MEPDSDINPRWSVTLMLFFATIAFPCLIIYQSGHSSQIHARPSQNIESEEVRLGRILKEASMNDTTVILTTLNQAWAAQDSIIDLFLESFRIGDHTRGLLNHLVIVGLDQKAHDRCLRVHNHCFALTTSLNFSKEAYFMTPKYLKMMWRRTEFLQSVLEMGYSFIFTDADVMWFRNPFPRFHKDADFQIACDNFYGDPANMKNRPNGGFLYVRSNNKTREFYNFWLSSRETYPGLNEQEVFDKIKDDEFVKTIGMKIRFLDTAYFGGFCEPSKNLNEVCTMHVNCCYGLNSKLIDSRMMLDDWRYFMSLPPSNKTAGEASWSVPYNCSLKAFHPPPTEDREPVASPAISPPTEALEQGSQ